jgi:hypothetical protein
MATKARRRSTAAPPPMSELEIAVKAMDLSYLQCRDFGHSWRPYTARWVPAENCYQSELQCQRCKSIRQRYLSRSGAQLGGHYDYPEGYLMPKGTGRLTGTDRDIIRLQSVLAVLVPDTAEEG